MKKLTVFVLIGVIIILISLIYQSFMDNSISREATLDKLPLTYLERPKRDKWLYVFARETVDNPLTSIDETKYRLLNPNPRHPEITQPRRSEPTK